jgi:hypothetical protein
MEQKKNKSKWGWLKQHALEIGLGVAAVGSLIYGLHQQQRASVTGRELGRVLDDESFLLGQIRAYEKTIKKLGRDNENLSYQLGKAVSGKL